MSHITVPMKCRAKSKVGVMAVVFAVLTSVLGVFGFARPVYAAEASLYPLMLHTTLLYQGQSWLPNYTFTMNCDFVPEMSDYTVEPSVTHLEETGSAGSSWFEVDWSGMATFTFTAKGTYVYKVSQVIPAAATAETNWRDPNTGIVYDPTDLYYTFVIDETSSGSLDIASRTSTGTLINNTGCHTWEDFSFNISKTIDGRAWEDGDSFEFEIKQIDYQAEDLSGNVRINQPTATISGEGQTVSIGDIEIMQSREYTFEISEKDVNDENMSVADPVLVKVDYGMSSSNGDYYVESAQISYDNGATWSAFDIATDTITFVNTYTEPAAPTFQNVSFPITKQLMGRDWAEGDDFTFKIEAVEPDDGAKINTSYVTIGEDTENHSTMIGDIEFTTSETRVFKITELKTATLQNITYADPILARVSWTLDEEKNEYVPTVEYSTDDGENWTSDDPVFVNTYTNPDDSTVVPDEDVSQGTLDVVDPNAEEDPKTDEDDKTVEDPKTDDTKPQDVQKDESKKDTDSSDDKVAKNDKTNADDSKKLDTSSKKVVTASAAKKTATPKTADATMVEGIVAIAASGSAILGTGFVLGRKRNK